MKRGKNGERPGPPVHDDLCVVTDAKGRMHHEFKADAPDELWIGDITEHWTGDGKLDLCAFKDVHSNRIMGYSIDSRMKSRLAVTALNNAVTKRGDVAGCVTTPTAAPSSEAGNLCAPWAITTWSGRWVAWVRAETTRPWNRSSLCSKTTSWTAASGPPEKSCGSQSWPTQHARSTPFPKPYSHTAPTR